MKISVRITRDENAEHFGVKTGDVVSVNFEEYVAAVTASEIGNSPVEACRAQAVAARTFAVTKGVLTGAVITDSSAADQAYRAKRYDETLYPNALQGARDTCGEILTYKGKPASTVYSACNGGRTVSSKERWGSERAYLPAQDDPWDNSAKRTGHGVGMSQRGAKYAAGIGKTYREILGFYYPGTELQKSEGGGRMIPAEAFVKQVKIPLEEKWGYIYGTHGVLWTAEKQAAATREQTVRYGSQWIGHMVTDCSGLIYWACLQLGEKTVHHATYLYTDWSRPKGKLVSIPANEAGETKGRDDGQTIQPGTLVFLKGSEPKIHHVGVYIGDDTVIEAKGTKSGVVTSRLSHWEYWGELKVIDYTGAEAPESGDKPVSGTRAVVCNPHTWLNVRNEPNEGANRVMRVMKGTTVDVVEMTNDDWWKISCNGKTGYAVSKYLQLLGSEDVTMEPQAVLPPDIPGWDITAQDENTWDADEHEIEAIDENTWATGEHESEEPEDAQEEPVQEPAGKQSLLDRIKGLFGMGKKEEPQEEKPQDGEAIMYALKTAQADLNILSRLVEDAQKAPSADALAEILNAMDTILPQIDQARKDMWDMITVG